MLREAPQAQHVDDWLNWAYNNLAEPYAEMNVDDFDDAVDELYPHTASDEPTVVAQAGASAKEWTCGPSPSAVATASLTNERWLHEMAIAELYQRSDALWSSRHVNTRGTSEMWVGAMVLLSERQALLSDKIILKVFRRD